MRLEYDRKNFIYDIVNKIAILPTAGRNHLKYIGCLKGYLQQGAEHLVSVMTKSMAKYKITADCNGVKWYSGNNGKCGALKILTVRNVSERK